MLSAKLQLDPTEPSTGGGMVAAGRGVQSQLLCRELNERICSLADRFGREGDFDFVCECVNGGCFEQLLVPLEDYEAVRRFPSRFLVKPGHDAEQTDRIVEENDQWAVVEKTGADAEAAILFDPRRRGAREEQVV